MDELAFESLRQELRPGEELLWAGRPRPGMRLRGEDVILIPFSLLWGGFAIFWETGVILSGKAPFFVLWGVPFVIVGLYLMIGRFFVDARVRSRTTYGMTPERVLVRTGLWRISMHTYRIAQLEDMRLDARDDGSGTVDLRPSATRGRSGRGAGWPAWQACLPWRLEDVAEARGVYECILDLQRGDARPYLDRRRINGRWRRGDRRELSRRRDCWRPRSPARFIRGGGDVA